jgi:hypothetical protein
MIGAEVTTLMKTHCQKAVTKRTVHIETAGRQKAELEFSRQSKPARLSAKTVAAQLSQQNR